MNTVTDNPLWTVEQAAEFLGFPVSALKKWRRIRQLREQIDSCNEGAPGYIPRTEIEAMIEQINGPKLSGPPFIRIGARKVRYRKSDIIAWAEDPT